MFIPLMLKWYNDEEWSDEKTRIYAIMFFGAFNLRFLNWTLIYYQSIFMKQKLYSKK